MNHAEMRFTGAGGREIFWQRWTPPAPPQSVIVLVHGAGEHSGRYAHVVASLVGQRHAVYALDHRGHGRSGGPRALIDRVDDAVADLDQLVVLAGEANPGVPVFMLGHSMGAMIALRYAVHHQDRLDGMILSGALAAVEGVPAPLRLIGRVLSAVAPRTPLIAIDPGLVSRDPAVVAAYVSDPLVHHGKLPARTAAEIADAVQSFPASVGAITIPALILYGTEDRLCPPAGSVMIGERIGSADRTVTAYPGLFHEIFNEPERDDVLADVCRWLAERVGAPAPDAADAAGSSRS